MSRRLSWAIAALAGLAWVPFVARPLSPDEGGFLLVASQWQPGRSLYGHYWVDRPPLLLTVFDVAAHLGGAVALRLMGIAVVVSSVLLTAHLSRRACGRRALTPVLVAGVFLSTPMFGTTVVNGELLAVPLVLTGLVLLVRAWQGSARWSVGAGAAAMAAMLVKQNVVDVLVVAAVLVVVAVRRQGGRRAVALTAGVASGALAALGAALALADTRGTGPTGLWDAVVAFRAHATSVISASATSATSGRFVSLLLAALLSGAPLLLTVLLVRLRARTLVEGAPDLRLPAVALLLWELVAVGAGGSYWLHYLIGLVPGMVLLAVAAAQRGPEMRRWTRAALILSVASCLVAVGVTATAAPRLSDDARVAAYLRSHSTGRASVVVAFGHPNIVWDAGLHSPYEQLWSLPVRVRDPQLTQLTDVLDGPHAPTWVVVTGESLDTWGVDARRADRALHARYLPVATRGDYRIWRHDPGRSGAIETREG